MPSTPAWLNLLLNFVIKFANYALQLASYYFLDSDFIFKKVDLSRTFY